MCNINVLPLLRARDRNRIKRIDNILRYADFRECLNSRYINPFRKSFDKFMLSESDDSFYVTFNAFLKNRTFGSISKRHHINYLRGFLQPHVKLISLQGLTSFEKKNQIYKLIWIFLHWLFAVFRMHILSLSSLYFIFVLEFTANKKMLTREHRPVICLFLPFFSVFAVFHSQPLCTTVPMPIFISVIFSFQQM